MDISTNNLITHKCHNCGSDLILMEVTTHTIGNNLSPITKSTYRCSNNICQEEADKQTAQRIALKKQQEEARLKRKEASLLLARKP